MAEENKDKKYSVYLNTFKTLSYKVPSFLMRKYILISYLWIFSAKFLTKLDQLARNTA